MKQNRKTIENQKGKNRMKTWIQNGHVLDPLTGTDQIYDVLVDGKDIKKLGTREEIAKILKREENVQVLDASGC